MKFILTVWVCSFLNNVCAPPVTDNIYYNSWNECVDAALDYSINFLKEQDVEKINNFQLATKFICKEIESV